MENADDNLKDMAQAVEPKQKSVLQDWVESIIIAAALAIFCAYFLFSDLQNSYYFHGAGFNAR